MTMTPEALRGIATILYGEEWQTPLARELGPLCPDPRSTGGPLAVRNVRAWASGARPVPKWVPGALQEIACERARRLMYEGATLTRFARGGEVE